MKFDLMQELLTKYKPYINFEFTYEEDGGMKIMFNDDYLVVYDDIIWKTLKKAINKILTFDKDNDLCNICFENYHNLKNNNKIICNDCLEPICLKCTIEIFIKNEGLSICPFCRNISGEKVSKPEAIIRGYMMKKGLGF